MTNIDKTSGNFSYYHAPITNTQPHKSISLLQAYEVIKGSYLQKPTQQLRLISDEEKNREFKQTNFPFVTVSGTFECRSRECLIEHSGLLAIDFDHVEDVEGFKLKLLNDIAFETELLFVSPNGNGIKWVISIADYLNDYKHDELAQRIFTYVEECYSVNVDRACKDLPRATFLCYDSTAFIHPKYEVK